jgi:hypothetical protein
VAGEVESVYEEALGAPEPQGEAAPAATPVVLPPDMARIRLVALADTSSWT